MTSAAEAFGVESVIEISLGDYRAVVAAQGASLKTLHFKDEPIVVVPLPVTDFTFAGSSLAPWANRLEDATWSLDDETFVGEITEPANHNGLHGLVVKRDFSVVSESKSSVTFRYVFGEDPVYPFALVFEVTYVLTERGLRVCLSATNRSSKTIPVSYGSHPYFAIDEDSELKVSAAKATINTPRQLPVAEQAIDQIGLEKAKFIPVAGMVLDDCLFELGTNPETVLTRPALSRQVRIWQDPSFAYQMIFVRGPMFAGEHPITVAIEPQTSPANALASKTAAVWLTPGETKASNWGISVD